MYALSTSLADISKAAFHQAKCWDGDDGTVNIRYEGLIRYPPGRALRTHYAYGCTACT